MWEDSAERQLREKEESMRFTKGKAAAVAVALGLSAALTLPCGATALWNRE